MIPPKQSPARAHGWIKTALGLGLVGVDVIALLLAFVTAHYARLTLPLFGIPAYPPPFSDYLLTMAFTAVVTVVVFFFSYVYHEHRSNSRIDQARNLAGAVVIGAVLASGFQDLIFKNSRFEVDYPRSLFFYVCVFGALYTILGREVYRRLRLQLRRSGVDSENLLIVGTGRVAREIIKKVQDNPQLGFRAVGIVNGKPRGKIMDVPIVGGYYDLPELIDSYGVGQVIIALPDAQRADLVDLITLCQRGSVDVKVYPDMFAYMAGDMNLADLDGTPLITVRDIALRGWKLTLKRGLDLVGAFFGLVFLSPFFLLTALLIKMQSPGPVFYAQERMGLDGKPFPMIKFRSMRIDAEQNGPGWTVPDDPRVTRIGKFMRRTNWDEIPQLINVLLGQMSLVGPRPERPVYVHQFRQQIPRYMERHREKAGMTGWAQVNGLRGDTSIAERTAYDLWYVENWSLWLDIKIIIRTVWQTLNKQNLNAY